MLSWSLLGDQAWLVYLNRESDAVHLTQSLRQANPSWLVDVVPAYASVGIFFDPAQVHPKHVQQFVDALPHAGKTQLQNTNHHRIPVCYERELDLNRVAVQTGLSRDAVIERHSGTVYQVYAIGFVPGFPYLGYLPPELRGVGRLASPRLRVEPGSIGLTGQQTGIYPLPRPGGWNLIGQTPLTIVDVADRFFPMQVGDSVEFFRIDDQEFHQLSGERLIQSSDPV